VEKKKYALLEIPSDVLPRLIVLPDKDEGKYLIFLDDVIE
jgi:polyphosphate kinase